MTLATEDFNRTDFTSLDGLTTTTGGQTWVKYTGGPLTFDTFGMMTHGNTGESAGAGESANVVKGLGIADVTMQFTVANLGASTTPQKLGFILRANATPDYFRIGWNKSSGKFEARDCYSGLEHVAATDVTATVTVGDVIVVEAGGSTITLKQNGTVVLTATGVHNTTNTWHGIQASAGTSQTFIAKPQMDDWSISAFTAPQRGWVVGAIAMN